MLRLVLAVALGRIAGALSRLFGRGGSAFPGLVAERISPTLIEQMAGSLREGAVLVTGTNGKTTTTKMLVSALEASGREVVTNPSGSNLERGVASALLGCSSWRGRVTGDIAVFECDEAAFSRLALRLGPRLVVVTNLARDQLDRYGELETAATHVAAGLRHAAGAVLNADDPRVAALGRGSAAASYYGGIEAIRTRVPSDRDLYDPDPEARPDVVLDVEIVDVLQDEPGQTVRLTIGDAEVAVRLRVTGIYNAYNAAAALAAAARLGVETRVAAEAIERTDPPFGRGQLIEYRDRRVVVLLAKNPLGLNQAIRVLCDVSEPVATLVAINDEIADGRDVSWLWDARIDELAATRHRFGAGGTRAADMALRFKYAGIPCWVEDDFAAALDRLVADSAPGDVAYVVPTYTAMLELLHLLQPGVPRHEAWT